MNAAPYEFWSAQQIAAASGCPPESIPLNWPGVVAALDARGIADRAMQAAAIGTIAIETASTFAPVREAFWLDEDWRRANLRYYPFYGRGYIQLTWEDGYASAGTALGLDLASNPDLALDPTVAAQVLAWYFDTHGGGPLIPEAARKGDWAEVRRLVQGGSDGLDRLIAITTALGETVTPTAPVYDPTTPVVPQNHDWDCAEQSTLWALTAFGRHPGDSWVENSMLDEHIESTDLGLMLGDGSGLARWITEQYGEFGFAAHNNASVSFDDVASVAGASPVLMGGHRWGTAGHWVGVRGYDRAADELLLANPADGYAGIYQTMTRQQFAQVAPCAMAVVTWGGTAAPAGQPDAGAPAPPADDPSVLKARIAELEAERATLISTLGYARGDVASALQTAIDGAQAAVTTLRALGAA